jgi:hypothetical protein
MRRVRFLGAGAALLGLAFLVNPGAGGDKGKDEPALPAGAFRKLVNHDAELLRDELARGSLDTKSTRKASALAFMIAVYADAALGKNGPDAAGLVALRKHALDIVALVGEGKRLEATALAAKLSPDIKAVARKPEPGVKKSGDKKAPDAKEGGEKVEAVAWAKKLTFDDVMHQFTSRRVGGLGLEKELTDIAEGKERLTGPDFDRLALLGYRLAMIGRVAAAYGDDKNEGGLKTTKNWQRFAGQLRGASLALAQAARDGKKVETLKAADEKGTARLEALKKERTAATREALDKVNTTCAKCHDVFRQ